MPVQFIRFLPLLLPAVCLADTTLDYDSSKNPDAEMSIHIKDGDVLMGGKSSKALYKAGSREIVVIDHTRQTFMVIDDAAAQKMNEQVTAMQDQMKAMMAQMQKQMANMTPEQRAMIEQTMKQQMPAMAAKPASTTVEPKGNDSVGGIACRIIVVKTDNQPAHEACVASSKALGVSNADYQSMLAAMDAMQEIMRKLSGGIGTFPVNVRDLDGIPVRMKNLGDGETSSLTGRSSATLDPDLFAIPSGYTQRPLMQ